MPIPQRTKGQAVTGAGPPTVSVVIPTTGRPELLDAVRSVRAQDASDPVEVVVVADGVAAGDLPAGVSDLVDRIVRHPERRGGGAARNSGVDAATGHHVAFLDDDDLWEPAKLTTQLALLASAVDPDRTVVSSRHVHVRADRPGESAPSPTHLLGPGTSVASYLFERRRPGPGRASMYTSTLVCARELACEVRWDDALVRHQDWDWVVRLDRHPGVAFVQAPEALVRIRTGSAGSISAGGDWESSLAWADACLRVQPEVYADFVAAQSLRYAVAARSVPGVRATVRRLVDVRRVPRAGPLVIGLGGLLPRNTIEQILRGR